MNLDKFNNNVSLISEARRMINDIEKAKEDWVVAQNLLDFVIETDQIDYAIYALEAAEKKYDMLLRQAKKMKLNLTEVEDTEGGMKWKMWN